MKLIEKDFIVSGAKCGTFCAYTEVEPELEITPDTPSLTRVLPAPYFYEKRLFFHLIKRIEPGGKVGFPNGGFEVRDEGGALRSFDLDQVIIHPHIIKHQKTLDKMARKAEKEATKRERERKKSERQRDKINRQKRSGGRRGRPALDPAIKAAREAEVAARAERSGGRRGRPKAKVPATKVIKPTGGKRGRPALTPEALAAKAQAKAILRARSGGKRGRPKRK